MKPSEVTHGTNRQTETSLCTETRYFASPRAAARTGGPEATQATPLAASVGPQPRVKPHVGWRTWRITAAGQMKSPTQRTAWDTTEAVAAHSEQFPALAVVVALLSFMVGYISIDAIYWTTAGIVSNNLNAFIGWVQLAHLIGALGGIALFPNVRCSKPVPCSHHKACSGLYSLTDSRPPTDTFMFNTPVWGEVWQWGRMVECAAGHTSQYAYPKRITHAGCWRCGTLNSLADMPLSGLPECPGVCAPAWNGPQILRRPVDARRKTACDLALIHGLNNTFLASERT